MKINPYRVISTSIKKSTTKNDQMKIKNEPRMIQKVIENSEDQ